MADRSMILEVRKLVVTFDAGRGRTVQAVSGVSFSIAKGETLGLVGESGCGKSSVARAIMQLPGPTAGHVVFCGQDLTRIDAGRLRRLRPQFQMIFQDAAAALNPRRRIGRIVEAPLKIRGNSGPAERERNARDMIDKVGLSCDAYDRRPHQFSGGQCQRIQLARALISRPKLLICDEPVSSLDVSVQAQIVNLLEGMRQEYGLTMLFISHDLAVVKNVCDRVAVMYLGRLCEIASSQNLYRRPAHPYTRTLLSAIPRPDPNRLPVPVGLISSEIPSPMSPPSGCRFHTRCPRAQKICAVDTPALKTVESGHQVACHFPCTATDRPLR